MQLAIQTGKQNFAAWIAHPLLLLREVVRAIRHEKKYMLAEMGKVAGLLPLLMKPRNGEKWTAQDKIELTGHLERVSHLSPYIAAVFVPGGFLMLPAFVWWLDRRRSRRLPERVEPT
jgi:hypothetical protein